jgi:hypothetical protein
MLRRKKIKMIKKEFQNYKDKSEYILKEFEHLVIMCRSLGKGEFYEPTMDLLQKLYLNYHPNPDMKKERILVVDEEYLMARFQKGISEFKEAQAKELAKVMALMRKNLKDRRHLK